MENTPTEEKPKRSDTYHEFFSRLLEKPIQRRDLIEKMMEVGFAESTAQSCVTWSKRALDNDNPFGFQTETYKDAEGNKWLVKNGEPAPPGLTKVTKKAGMREKTFDQLENGEDTTRPSPDIHKLMTLASRTRNLLLYGPPGTGKTYTLAKFREAFLDPQLSARGTPQARTLDIISELAWWEVAWAAMYKENRSNYSIAELIKLPWIQDRISLTTNRNLYSTLTTCMAMLTDPTSATVKFKIPRREPYLFNKTKDTRWFLTAEGKDYAENEGKEILARLEDAEKSPLSLEDFSVFTTFHQSFAYEEFVEGLKPRLKRAIPDPQEDEKSIQYEIADGIFRIICKRAEKAWKDAGSPKNGHGAPKFLLIIDEINRANIAKVFGELITLIEDDKRIGCDHPLTVKLPYSQDDFGVPPNLYILGTLNTADRSIAQLDLALRRRFTFIEMMPDENLVPENAAGLPLRAIFTELNKRITRYLDRDHQIGHSYFMNITNAEDIHFAFTYRILPLLQEYFYNDISRLHAILGDAFFNKLDDAESDEARYQFNPPLDPPALIDALQQISQPIPQTT